MTRGRGSPAVPTSGGPETSWPTIPRPRLESHSAAVQPSTRLRVRRPVRHHDHVQEIEFQPAAHRGVASERVDISAAHARKGLTSSGRQGPCSLDTRFSSPSRRATERHSAVRIWVECERGGATPFPCRFPSMPGGSAPCFWRNSGKPAIGTRHLQCRHSGTRRRGPRSLVVFHRGGVDGDARASASPGASSPLGAAPPVLLLVRSGRLRAVDFGRPGSVSGHSERAAG